MPGLRSLSVRERILVYLHEFGEVQEPQDVADQLTQERIMEMVDAPRGSVSRALKKLVEKEMVKGELAHVPGGKRRQKAYMLTFKGYPGADEFVTLLFQQVVTFMDSEGESRRMNLGDAWGRIRAEAADLNMVDVLMLCEDADVLDIRNLALGEPLAKEEPKVVKERPKVKVSGVPDINRFFGRGEELEWLENAFEGSKIIFIYGMPGMGKTALASKYVPGIDDRVVWTRVAEYHSLFNLLEEIGKGLQEQGANNLAYYLDSVDDEGLDIGNVLSVLRQDAAAMDILLVFDDLQRANRRIIRFFGYLKDALEDMDGLRLLCLSRRLVPFYDARDVKVKGLVAQLELEGLDETGAGELVCAVLDLEEPDPAQMGDVFKATGGHPMALELVRSLEGASKFGDMDGFLLNEVLDDLDDEERGLLELMSVFRRPEPREAFMLKGDVKGDILERLGTRGVVAISADGGYGLQGMLKDTVYRWMSVNNRVANHETVADYYSQMLPLDGLSEAVHHLTEAGKTGAGGEIVVQQGQGLVSEGYAELVMDVITAHDFSGVDNDLLRKLEDLREGILLTWGDWDNVFEYYYQCYQVQGHGQEGATPHEVHTKAGPLGWSVMELDLGLANQRQSLKHLDRMAHGDRGEVFRTIAWTSWMKGDVQTARESYEQALGEIGKAGLGPEKDALLARVLMGLGNTFWELGEPGAAFEHYKKAAAAMEEGGDIPGQVRALNGQGIVLLEQDEHDKAAEVYKIALDLARRVNFLRGEAYVLLHLGVCSLLKGDTEDGEAYIHDALGTFKNMGDRLGQAYSLATLGIALGDNGGGFLGEAEQLLFDPDLAHYKSLLRHLGEAE